MKTINSHVSHLTKVYPFRVYAELILYGFIAIGSYIYLVFNFSWFLFLLSAVFSYRGLAFLHEVSHLEKKIKFIVHVYNFIFGYFNRLPAYSMTNHKYHHSVTTYGTIRDPEYDNWTVKPKIVLLRPLALAILHPFLLTLRFGIIPAIRIVLPKKAGLYLYEKASTFVMNSNYSRPYTHREYREMLFQDFMCSVYFFLQIIALIAVEKLGQGLLIWAGITSCVSFLNTSRALIAHRYQSHKSQRSDKQLVQLTDAVTVEGGWLTELWAPLGLRYHSTHHFLPNVPYYSLGKVHRILKERLPKNHPYHETIEKSFFETFNKFVRSFK